MCSTTAIAQEYVFMMSKGNVDAYYKWSCSSCSDRHIRMKIVNNNNYKVTYKFGPTKWRLAEGKIVGKGEGSSDDIKANGEQFGDMAGLYFYPPKGLENVISLQFLIENFIVKKYDGAFIRN